MSEIPDGQFAIVEVLGHRTYVGRIEEVDRFGTKMLQVEPIFRGGLLPPVLIGGSSIYQFTPCTKSTAIARCAQDEMELPQNVGAASAIEIGLLAPPKEEQSDLHFLDDTFLKDKQICDCSVNDDDAPIHAHDHDCDIRPF